MDRNSKKRRNTGTKRRRVFVNAKSLLRNTKKVNSSNLNPNAKPFVPFSEKANSELNPSAKPFVPLFFRNSVLNNTHTNKKNIENENNMLNKTRIFNTKENALKGIHMPSYDVKDYIAIDCEMVGVGPRKVSALAEVSLVNYFEEVIYHKYVIPEEPVTDYRTHVSGITPEILKEKGEPFKKVKKELESILKDKILVGHGLQNDINVIGIPIPKDRRWDTTEIPMFMRKSNWGGPPQAKKLKVLAKNFLGENIQTGEHSATQDAEASMKLFKWYSTNVFLNRMSRVRK